MPNPVLTVVGPNGPIEFKDNNSSSFMQPNGSGAVVLVDATGKPVAGVGSSGDKWDMFKARAQAFMNGEFTTQMIDKWGANTDVATSGFGGSPASVLAQVTSGRAGGAKMNMSAAAGTGWHFESGATQGTGGNAIMVADQIWDPWYVETGFTLKAATSNAEVGVGLYSLSSPFTPAGDGTSVYMSLGISLNVSTSFLVVRAYSGTALVTQVTTIPIEFFTYRRYFLAHDGMSTVYWGRDGVVFGSRTMFDQQPSTTGVVFTYERANGGTFSVDYDYYAGAGVAP